MATLSPEHWQEISPHLDEALSLPEDERAAWLAAKPELADLLFELLQEHRALAEQRFLECGPAVVANSSLGGQTIAGQTIGAYTLISPIGQGGMGSVWLAEPSDGRFKWRVAVKFLRFSVAATGAARFKREGRILGQFAHPHIAELIRDELSPTRLERDRRAPSVCSIRGIGIDSAIDCLNDLLHLRIR
jgi:hypothetical protein